MPTVNFVCQIRGINRSINMPAPRKVQDLYKGWYKAAKERIPNIPEIPELVGHLATEWHLQSQPTVTPKWITYDLINTATAEKAQLVIDRKGPPF